MHTKADMIKYTLTSIKFKTDESFKLKFHAFLSTPADNLYLKNALVPSNAFEYKPIVEGCYPVPYRTSLNGTKLTPIEWEDLEQLTAKLQDYFNRMRKLKKYLIDLANNFSDKEFESVMNFFIYDQLIPEHLEQHPFWAEYNKQVLTNKLLGL